MHTTIPCLGHSVTKTRYPCRWATCRMQAAVLRWCMTSTDAPVPTSDQMALPPGTYRVDPEQSTITFTTRHMFGLQAVHGSFTLLSAELKIADPPESSTTRAVIDAASFHTDQAKRNTHVASSTFLHVDEHPHITFVSSQAQQDGGGWLVPGTLTVKGVERPVTLRVDAPHSDGRQWRLRATTRIDRRAHGITAARGMAGRHLDLEFTLLANPV